MLGLIVAGATGAFVLYYLVFMSQHATVVTHAAAVPPRVAAALERCPALTQGKFYPLPWLVSGHLQTLAASALRRKPAFTYRRELVPLSDGGQAALDWFMEAQAVAGAAALATPPTQAVMIILHGTNGGSDERYVRHMVMSARRCGFLPAVFIMRGENGTLLTNTTTYSAGGTQDLREVIQHAQRQFPSLPFVAVGFSIGGNILARYIGEDGERCPLRGAVAVSNPLDLWKSCERITKSVLHKLYDGHLATGLVRYARQHLEALAACPAINLTRALATRSAFEYLSSVSCKLWGYDNAHDYCDAHSSLGHLRSVRIPLLCLNARDDPIVCPSALVDAAELVRTDCPYVVMAITECGGHVAWLEPALVRRFRVRAVATAFTVPVYSWADRVCCEFLQATLCA
eukprot:TRINITY_DN3977_c0_g1_i1.p1 TRINITY_DN3977_c0_g1~~TRINITY_DN3977_c0_g1_i1.p1  ORF type:complete len:431 (+),score=109.33 TRINITY_DN3977_c0_g1_i1:91-1293(+)